MCCECTSIKLLCLISTARPEPHTVWQSSPLAATVARSCVPDARQGGSTPRVARMQPPARHRHYYTAQLITTPLAAARTRYSRPHRQAGQGVARIRVRLSPAARAALCYTARYRRRLVAAWRHSPIGTQMFFTSTLSRRNSSPSPCCFAYQSRSWPYDTKVRFTLPADRRSTW